MKKKHNFIENLYFSEVYISLFRIFTRIIVIAMSNRTFYEDLMIFGKIIDFNMILIKNENFAQKKQTKNFKK